MKKFCALFLPLLICFVSVGAQTAAKWRISGRVIDSTTSEAVAFATVIIRDTLDKPFTSTYSDEKGTFHTRLQDGNYTVVVGFTGYTPDTLALTVRGEHLNLGTIAITEGVAVGSVQVLGQLITSDVDKMSYNTSADPETPALTALEMMRKVPMLTVDGEDNLQLKGQSDYKILVNGKPSTMMSRNYKEVLKSMPASSVIRIEVITNPPAKYDAEGVGGLINIVTTRRATDGFNGSINTGVDQWGGVNGGAYVAVQSGKFALSTNLNIGQHQSPETGGWSRRIDSTSTDRYRLEDSRSGSSKGLFGGLGLEASYQIDTANLVTLSINGFGGNGKSTNNQLQQYYSIRDVLDSEIVGKSTNNYQFFSVGGNLDYQHTFKNPDETLTASYRIDANPYSSDNEMKALQDNDPAAPFSYDRRSKNSSQSVEQTLQVDYFNPLTKVHTIEVGAKYILRPNSTDNLYERFDPQTGQWNEEPELKNDLNYDQHIGSFYGGYAAKLNWLTAKVGYRGELTINDGAIVMAAQDVPMFNRYFNIVPYATLNFKLNQSNSIRVGYTQRINRPGIWTLSPYVNDLDPSTVSTGNPDLEATLNHNVNIDYSIYNRTWNFGVSASGFWANNAVQRVSWLVKEGEYAGRIWQTFKNIAATQNYRMGMNGGARFFENKLNFSLNLSAAYSVTDSQDPNHPMHSEGFGYNGYANLGGQPWKGGNVNLYGGFYASAPGLQFASSPDSYHGLSISQSMLKNSLRVSLSCSDPFQTKKYYRYETWGAGFSSSSESWRYGRNIRLGVQWNFGKRHAEIKKARRGISNDDGGGGGKPSGN